MTERRCKSNFHCEECVCFGIKSMCIFPAAVLELGSNSSSYSPWGFYPPLTKKVTLRGKERERWKFNFGLFNLPLRPPERCELDGEFILWAKLRAFSFPQYTRCTSMYMCDVTTNWFIGHSNRILPQSESCTMSGERKLSDIFTVSIRVLRARSA